MGGKKKSITVNKKRNKGRKGFGTLSNKDNNKKSTKPKSASSQIDEVSSSYSELTSKMASTLNMLSKFNIVNKEKNRRRKGAGTVSKKENKEKLQNSSQNEVRQMNVLLHMVNI